MTTLYGIKNCDTVKKTRKWLEARGIDYQFHDFRQDGINKQLINGWLRSVDWQTLVNKRSTTWKQLDDSIKNNLSEKTVVGVLIDNPTLIKRPVLACDNGRIEVGFNESVYAKLFV